MLITYKEMQRRVGERIQNTDTGTGVNDLITKTRNWINERYHRIIRGFSFEENLGDQTMSMVASQRAYGMDWQIDKIWAIYDQTNGKPIPIKDVQYYVRNRALDLDQTGNVVGSDPTMCYPVGTYTVKAAIGSTGEKITIVSSSDAATEKTTQIVRVSGLVSGAMLQEAIVLNGTTEVDSTNTWDASQKLTISVGTSDGSIKTVVGVITVDGKTSSTVFTVISPRDIATLYKWYEVSPLPKADGTQPTWRLFYSKRLQPMTNDNDIPVIDCCNEILQGTYVDALKEDGQNWETEEQNWVAQVQELYADQDIPGRIEQFQPSSPDLVQTLDYGRTIGAE